jgi:hypothetical protein
LGSILVRDASQLTGRLGKVGLPLKLIVHLGVLPEHGERRAKEQDCQNHRDSTYDSHDPRPPSVQTLPPSGRRSAAICDDGR